MVVTVTPRVIAGKDGRMKKITTKTFHCESCGSFVRSIDEDDDGMSYGDYVEQLTYLLFLKMADERTKPPYNQPSAVRGKGSKKIEAMRTLGTLCPKWSIALFNL